MIIYDIEVFPNLFVVSFTDGECESTFIVSEHHNDLKELLIFIHENKDKYFIGFNNLHYDYPVIKLLFEQPRFIYDRYHKDPIGFLKYIYERSKDIINCSKDEWYEKYQSYDHKQIDLFKILHLDNKAKLGTSLKWIQFGINSKELQVFEHDFDSPTDDIDGVVKYNLNDIRSTYELLVRCQKDIEYRLKLSDIETLNLLNLSNTAIAKKIFSKYLMDEMEIPYSELKELRTYHKSVKLSNIILPYIKFNHPEFNKILDELKYLSVSDTREINKTIVINKLHYNYGSGGLHAFSKAYEHSKSGDRKAKARSIASKYISNDKKIILVDVSSFYPNIAIQNGFKPKHLGNSFITVYNDIYQRRAKAKYSGDKIIDMAMKNSLNSVFGLSKQEHSFFYDIEFLLSITINGQLLLSMLCDMFISEDIEILQANTDGIYVYTDKPIQHILDEWMRITKLKLDVEYFDRLIQRDVNNYIALGSDGKIKRKGVFEYDKDYHEDHSQKIVAMALEQYFLFDVDYKTYIKNTKEILPFLMGVKLHKGSVIELRGKTTQQYKKAFRYIVSKTGSGMYKIFQSGEFEQYHKGYKITDANILSSISRENINDQFYITETEKIISLFDTQQLTLF